jgi:hypothetical protein
MKVFAVHVTGGAGAKAKPKKNELNANANKNRSGVARLTTPIGRGSASGNPLRNRKSK